LVYSFSTSELFAIFLNSAEIEFSSYPKETQQLLKEYSDVFPNELPKDLPPQCSVDHAIELVPGSEPPSRLIYRFSFEKTNELKR